MKYKQNYLKFLIFTIALTVSSILAAQGVCQGYGPQTPRDISYKTGANERIFTLAPLSSKMNLCNIHTHTNAEHKGPGFSIFAGGDEHGGYKCNESDSLSESELSNPAERHGEFHGVKPGDTIEVHWVYTSCDIEPGEGLGSCLSDECANPELRVESQVFLVVNDNNALDFNSYSYQGNKVDGLHQAMSLPDGTGQPVLFAGSTTGPKYTESDCSPYQVTWSVRPQCAKVDINSIFQWAEQDTVFKESHSHGVRQLVTDKSLLSEIE